MWGNTWFLYLVEFNHIPCFWSLRREKMSYVMKFNFSGWHLWPGSSNIIEIGNIMKWELVLIVNIISHSSIRSDLNRLYCSFLTDLHLHDTPLKLRLWSLGVTCVWQLGQVSSVLDQSETEHWAPYSPGWEILCNFSRRHRTSLAGIAYMYVFTSTNSQIGPWRTHTLYNAVINSKLFSQSTAPVGEQWARL